MENMPNNLPEMRKSDEDDPNKFEEKGQSSDLGKSRTIWIIVLAFALLVCFGVIIWLVFSGRPDQKIQDNLPKESAEEQEKDKTSDFDESVVVNATEINLTDYDSNITITSPGEHTLSGILNYSVFVKSDGPVTLNLNGITISSAETAAIVNRTTNPLNVVLLENTTNTLTDGGESKFDSTIFSYGPLTISSTGEEKTFGSLIISGRQKDGEGIATSDNNLEIQSGKIMITATDDGLNAGGENGGTISINGGVLWIRAGGDGIDSNKDISINGGNILVMGSTEGGNAALDSDYGIVINGGNLVALGTDMLENPLESSPQPFLSLNLNSTIKTGSTIYVKNTTTNKIVNFKTESDFKTLVFSTPSLEKGNYEISVDGQVVGTGEIK